MRILVCGSRHLNEYNFVAAYLDDYFMDIVDEGCKRYKRIHDDEQLIIEGGARGADSLARKYAIDEDIPYWTFNADWEKHGKAAGPIRNKRMLDEGKPDLVIAFMAENSRGTKNMVDQATLAGVPVKVINI